MSESIPTQAEKRINFSDKKLKLLVCPANCRFLDYFSLTNPGFLIRVSQKSKIFYFRKGKVLKSIAPYCPKGETGLTIEGAREQYLKLAIEHNAIKNYSVMNMTLNDYISSGLYVEHRKLNSENVSDKILSELKSGHAAIGDVKLKDFSTALLQEFYSELDVSISTKAKRYRLLKSMFNTLIKVEITSKFPFNKNFIKFKEPDPEPQVLAEHKTYCEAICSESEFKKFNLAGRLVTLSCLVGGFRQSELLKNFTYNFYGANNPHPHYGTGIFVPTSISKNRKQRFVSITVPQWLDMLDEYVQKRAFLFDKNANPNEHMFLNPDTRYVKNSAGCKPYSAQIYRSVWSYLTKKFGIDDTLYSARHTVASLIISSTGDINAAALYIGNSAATTEKHYRMAAQATLHRASSTVTNALL